MRHGARVVTAAALIMMSVFAGFILADDAIIKVDRFRTGLGVARRRVHRRMTIVPAVLSLLGRSARVAAPLADKLLPQVDVDGEQLTKLATAGAEPRMRTRRCRMISRRRGRGSGPARDVRLRLSARPGRRGWDAQGMAVPTWRAT